MAVLTASRANWHGADSWCGLDRRSFSIRSALRRGFELSLIQRYAVNTLDDPGRDRVIAQDYLLLRDDLEALMSDRSTPLVLIKATVCRILEPRLLGDGFNVINRGRIIYFPAAGRQSEFHRQFRAVLKLDEIRSC